MIYIILIIFLIIFLVKLFSVTERFESSRQPFQLEPSSVHFSHSVAQPLQVEHLTQTSDEAIQNLASLYNRDQLTITNLDVTGKSNINNLVSPNGSITNFNTDKIKLGNKWLLSGVVDDDWLRFYKADGSQDYYGGIAAGKLMTADGTINGRKIFDEIDSSKKVNIVYPTAWDQTVHIRHIQDNNYFNKNMPDGTILSFLFVHPGNMDQNHPNRWIAFRQAIKYGNQFLLFPSPYNNHENIPNPQNNNNKTTDPSYRGNIN